SAKSRVHFDVRRLMSADGRGHEALLCHPAWGGFFFCPWCRRLDCGRSRKPGNVRRSALGTRTPRHGPGRARCAGPERPRTAYVPSPEPMQARPIRNRPTGDPAHVERREGTMGEAEHTDRETRTGARATAADDGDPAACTVGANSADSGPADLGAKDG